MKHVMIIAGALVLAGCAQGPDSIAPVSVSPQSFDYLTCNDTRAEYTRTRATLTALEGQQRNAVAGDAIGVFLIGVPVSSLSGGDKAGLIASEKGKLIALESRIAKCGAGQ